MTHRKTIAVLGLTGIAALAAVPVQAGIAAKPKPKPQKKTIGVHDNYYGPAKLTVNNGSTITWRWEEDAADIHDLKLTKGPKGVKQSSLTSDPGSAGYEFKRKLTKPGTYKFICTFHVADGMKMSITVRK